MNRLPPPQTSAAPVGRDWSPGTRRGGAPRRAQQARRTMSKRTTPLPFALPDLDDEEVREVTEVLRSGWITTGPKAHQFEREFATYVGAKFAISVNSCTAAMHLALEALDVRAGDFVLTSPYTFAATAEVIRYFDAVPVFVDVEADTLNMDPEALADTIDDLKASQQGTAPRSVSVARAVGKRGPGTAAARAPEKRDGKFGMKAVIPVHIAGHACEM